METEEESTSRFKNKVRPGNFGTCLGTAAVALLGALIPTLGLGLIGTKFKG